MAGSPYDRRQYRRTRAAMVARGDLCVHCPPGRKRPATEWDHQPPLVLHHHVEFSGCCRLVPSCSECARLQGGLLAGAGSGRAVGEVEVVEPVGFGRRDAVWDVPWLSGLRRRVPVDSWWPRLMTVPHPAAVGSLGSAVAGWAARRRGRRWRWSQRLVAARALEVDAAGELVWETVLLSMSRQSGKTWLLHDLCAWRLEAGERFGGAQSVLSVAKDLAVARRMQEPSMLRARTLPELYRARRVNGDEGITWWGDGSEWLVRSKDAGYSLTTSMATVDEAWKVPASTVDDSIVPTMVEQSQTQLWLVSTAHRRATGLMIGRRTSALEQLADPPAQGGVLLVEWSAGPERELEDRQGWREASAHWSAKRERLIAQRLAAALAGESDDVDEPDAVESINTQWLNRWPAKRQMIERGEELVEVEAWRASRVGEDSVGPLVVAIEDHGGKGAALAAAGRLGDGRVVLGGRLVASRGEAYRLAGEVLDVRVGSMLVVGLALAGDPALPASALKAGRVETQVALSALRDGLADGRVVHDDCSPELDAQVAAARVVEAASGLQLVGGARGDLLRAALWALLQAVREPVGRPAILTIG